MLEQPELFLVGTLKQQEGLGFGMDLKHPNVV